MRAISEVSDQELTWLQPAARKQAYELRAGEEVVATLRWQRGSLADAEAADHHWTYKREGFWHPRVTARVPGSDADVALFQPTWMGGGTLELPTGRNLRFGAANVWHSQWVWQEPDGTALVHFKSRQGFLKTEGQVEVAPAAVDLADLPLLVLLGWYLLVLFARDAAAAGSVAATVAAVG